jgi:hypothetical protein
MSSGGLKTWFRRRWPLVIVIGVVVALTSMLTACGGDDDDGATTSSSSTTSGEAPPALCGQGKWPVVYISEPTAMGSPTGLSAYVWRDQAGWEWHVRVVDPAGQATFTVVVKGASGLFPEAFELESQDRGTVDVKGATATFEVRATGEPLGFDFDSCLISAMTIEVSANGQRVDPSTVFVGVGNVAEANPLAIGRR